MNRSRRGAVLLDLAGAIAAIGYLLLAVGDSGGPGIGLFLGVSGGVGAISFFLYRFFHNRPQSLPVSRLILWAVVFRLIRLFGEPFFEVDYFRYLWDGYRFAETGTPYGHAPEESFGNPEVPEALKPVLDQVNNPDLPTIYGPVLQILFLLGYWVSPGSVGALQALFVVFDLVLIALLLRMVAPPAVLLYAWSPLVVKEVAFTAHTDGFAVCFVLAAVLLARRGRFLGAAALLGIASGARVFALLAVPFVLRKAGWRAWLVFPGVLALFYAPFLGSGGSDLFSLLVFAREWEFNALGFGLLRLLLPQEAARIAAALLFLAALAWLYLRAGKTRGQASEARFPGEWVYGALLFLSPVINPWYLLWLLPFAAIRPSVTAWTASLAVLLSYCTGLNLQDFSLHPFGHPWWVRPAEFAFVSAAAAFDLFRAKRRRGEAPRKRMAAGSG